MRKKYYLLFLILLLQNTTFAQTINDLTEVVYSYSFTTAKQRIENKQLNNSLSSSELSLININYYWWQFLSGNIEKQYQDLCLQTCLNYRHPRTTENYNEVFHSAIVFSYIIRIYAAQGKYFKAIYFLEEAMPYFENALENEDKHESLMLISGLYNYVITYSLDRYPLFYSYLFFYSTGDKSHGLDLLKKCAKSRNVVIQTEAKYFLMKIYFELEKKYTGAQLYAEQLVKEYPNNLVYRYEYYKILFKQKLYNRAEQQKNIIISLSRNNKELNVYQRKHFITLL